MKISDTHELISIVDATRTETVTSVIQHRLDKSRKLYEKDVSEVYRKLIQDSDPVKIMRRLR